MKLLGLRNQISIDESVRLPGLSRSVIRLDITAIIGLPFTDTVIDEVGGVVVTQPSLNWPSSWLHVNPDIIAAAPPSLLISSRPF